jgi:hypothetical protein
MKKFFDSDFFSSVSMGLFLSAFIYQIWLLLFFSTMLFFVAVSISSTEDTESSVFNGDEYEELNIKIIGYEHIIGTDFMFFKDGFKIFRVIYYNNEYYDFYSESYKLNLKKYQEEDYLLLYPGILYKKH